MFTRREIHVLHLLFVGTEIFVLALYRSSKELNVQTLFDFGKFFKAS